MTYALPHLPHPAAAVDSMETLVELLVAHVAQAYVTAEQPGALAAVREMFGRMDQASLTALVHEMGLETEPVREHEAGDQPLPGME
jgi:hypothetical protein